MMKYLSKYMKTMCWAVAATALLLATSCKDDDDKSLKGFAVDQSELLFENNGGTIELKVATDQTWTAEAENDWCMISPATGVGSGVCVIKADSSYLYHSRQGRIIFYTENGDLAEVSVSQFGYERTIEVTEAEKVIPSYATPEEAYVDIEAVANVPFEVIIPEEAQTWLSIDGVSTYTPSSTVPRKQKFRLRFKTYTEFTADRVAEVKLVQTEAAANTRSGEGPTGEPITKVVKIIQEKGPVIIPSREGDSLSVLSIIRTINAGMSFSPSRPITHWDNVVTEERTYRYCHNGIDKDSTELRVVGFSLSIFDTDESVPYQIQYMTELETFAAVGNANGFLRKIELGPEITKLKKLKSLSLLGYGVCKLPQEMAQMESLEELDLTANTILNLNDIRDVLLGLKDHLKYLALGGNRISFVVDLNTDIPKDKTLETIGLGGNLADYDWLFSEMSQLESLSLSYNYFYGSIPNFGGTKEGILPNVKHLTLNLNRLTGEVPNWILYHKYLACWNPFLLVFNQEGRDTQGTMAGFPNAPTKYSEFPAEYNRVCPEDEEAQEIAVRLPELTEAEINVVPLHGNWRYYQMLNKEWYKCIK